MWETFFSDVGGVKERERYRIDNYFDSVKNIVTTRMFERCLAVS